MKKRKILKLLTALSFLTLIIPNAVKAAPAPWGIAINEATDECGEYWAGDEFTFYPLLNHSWEAYYPTYESGDETYETPYGECKNLDAKGCCEKLGFTYISGNIGYEGIRDLDDLNDEPLGGLWDPTIPFILLSVCCCVILTLVITVTVFIFIKKRK